MSQELEYYVPQLGKITARLYEWTEKTYQLLEHYKHVERMRRIDQLGVIRNVYEGAHHSRWEYVMLQLSLIYKLSVTVDETGTKPAKGLGLGTRNIDFLGYKPSGADILQMWALLFNAGHLPGTFATERALLKYCGNDRDLRQTIHLGLPQKKRGYFKQVLNTQDIYSLHKVLISFHLERYRKYRLGGPHLVNFLQEIIDLYLFDRNDHRERQRHLKALFQRIRQVAYLFLDSQYGPSPVDFDLATVFLNLQDYVPVLFRDLDSPILRVLDSYENLLSVSMYHSADSMRELGAHVRRIEYTIEEKKATKELCKITGLHKYLMTAHGDLRPRHTEWRGAFSLHLLLEPPFFAHLILEMLRRHLTYRREEECVGQYGTRTCQIVFQSAPSSAHLAITLSFLPNTGLPKQVRVIGRFLRDIFRLNTEARLDAVTKRHNLQDVVDYTFQGPYQHLIISILSQITDRSVHFEFTGHDAIGHLPFFATRGSRKAADHVKRARHGLDASHSRSHELQTLEHSLRHLVHRSDLLVCLLRLLVYDGERRHLTDLDGLALGVADGRLGILMVEAKDHRQGGISASKKQLKRTLQKLNFRTAATPQVVEVAGGAYCYLQIDGLSESG